MKVTPEDIIRECCKEGNITEASFYSNSRKREISNYRQLAAKIIKDKLKLSYKVIGQIIAGVDNRPFHHTSAMHSYTVISDLIEIGDQAVITSYNNICDRLYYIEKSIPITVYMDNNKSAKDLLLKIKTEYPEAKVIVEC